MTLKWLRAKPKHVAVAYISHQISADGEYIKYNSCVNDLKTGAEDNGFVEGILAFGMQLTCLALLTHCPFSTM